MHNNIHVINKKSCDGEKPLILLLSHEFEHWAALL